MTFVYKIGGPMTSANSSSALTINPFWEGSMADCNISTRDMRTLTLWVTKGELEKLRRFLRGELRLAALRDSIEIIARCEEAR
jgi:hypothetical protein